MKKLSRYFTCGVVLTGLAQQGIAQPSAAKLNEAAVMRAVESVVAEHRIYATCFSLDKTGSSLAAETWRREVGQAMEFLKTREPSAAFVVRFAAAVDFSKLLDKDARLSAVMELCHRPESEQAVKKFYELGFTRLTRAMQAAASGR